MRIEKELDAMAISRKDSDLLSWARNFDQRVSSAPGDYGLDASQAAQFHDAYVAYLASYQVVSEAQARGARDPAWTSAKEQAKAELLQIGRELYSFVQSSRSVPDDKKQSVGVRVKKTNPTAVPRPTEAPQIDILMSRGRTVSILLHRAESLRRARPEGTIGAAVFSYIGQTPPASLSDWTFEFNTSKTTLNVSFPGDVPSGATVWFTAFWFNSRKQSGPTSAPTSTNLPGGAVSMPQMLRAA
jgi:hypothetical protein